MTTPTMSFPIDVRSAMVDSFVEPGKSVVCMTFSDPCMSFSVLFDPVLLRDILAEWFQVTSAECDKAVKRNSQQSGIVVASSTVLDILDKKDHPHG